MDVEEDDQDDLALNELVSILEKGKSLSTKDQTHFCSSHLSMCSLLELGIGGFH